MAHFSETWRNSGVNISLLLKGRFLPGCLYMDIFINKSNVGPLCSILFEVEYCLHPQHLSEYLELGRYALNVCDLKEGHSIYGWQELSLGVSRAAQEDLGASAGRW